MKIKVRYCHSAFMGHGERQYLCYNLPSDEIVSDSIERHVMKKSNKSSS